MFNVLHLENPGFELGPVSKSGGLHVICNSHFIRKAPVCMALAKGVMSGETKR